MIKEFERLVKKNLRLQKQIDKKISHLEDYERSDFWVLINSLIANELEQERLCNN